MFGTMGEVCEVGFARWTEKLGVGGVFAFV